MTEFGREVWVLAAKRGITSQRGLAREIDDAVTQKVNHDTVRNYLHGRTSVPPRFLHQLDATLGLTEEEKAELGRIYAWGQTTWETPAPPSRQRLETY
jgi:hypothetical protein